VLEAALGKLEDLAVGGRLQPGGRYRRAQPVVGVDEPLWAGRAGLCGLRGRGRGSPGGALYGGGGRSRPGPGGTELYGTVGPALPQRAGAPERGVLRMRRIPSPAPIGRRAGGAISSGAREQGAGGHFVSLTLRMRTPPRHRPGRRHFTARGGRRACAQGPLPPRPPQRSQYPPSPSQSPPVCLSPPPQSPQFPTGPP